MLSSPFQIRGILKLTPVLSKIRGNAFGAHFLQLYCKNESSDPIFYFIILIRTVRSINEKKIGLNPPSVFCNFNKL